MCVCVLFMCTRKTALTTLSASLQHVYVVYAASQCSVAQYDALRSNNSQDTSWTDAKSVTDLYDTCSKYV